MLKKAILLLILVAIVTGGVFAEDNAWNNSFNIGSGPTPQNGALFVDLGSTLVYLLLGGFGVGLGWEGRINDFSTYLISGNFGSCSFDFGSLLGYKYKGFGFGVDANYRYYIFKSALDKLFINAGLGFSMMTWNYSYDPRLNLEDDSYSWGALCIPLYAGYKVIIGPGFVVELDLGYRIGIKVSEPSDYKLNSSPDFGGLIYGLALGWAF
jgi:hypothetical protein